MFGVGGQAMLLPVLAKVLSKTPDSSKLPENNKPVHSVDELSVDQMKEYQKKMGTWRVNTLKVANDKLWWIAADCLRISGATLVQFSAPGQQD